MVRALAFNFFDVYRTNLSLILSFYLIKVIFSLLHDTIVPHSGHFAVFPLNVAVSKASLFPNAIGDENSAEQFVHVTIVLPI